MREHEPYFGRIPTAGTPSCRVCGKDAFLADGAVFKWDLEECPGEPPRFTLMQVGYYASPEGVREALDTLIGGCDDESVCTVQTALRATSDGHGPEELAATMLLQAVTEEGLVWTLDHRGLALRDRLGREVERCTYCGSADVWHGMCAHALHNDVEKYDWCGSCEVDRELTTDCIDKLQAAIDARIAGEKPQG